jgi:co-chaperonin GroES (HSP10)
MKTMTVKAVLHRLVVKPVDLVVYDPVDAKLKELGFEKAVTEESKYHKTQIDQGYVIDVGPTAFLDYVKKHDLPVPVRVGSLVTYARHSGKTITDGDEEVVVLNDEDILVYHVEE